MCFCCYGGVCFYKGFGELQGFETVSRKKINQVRHHSCPARHLSQECLRTLPPPKPVHQKGKMCICSSTTGCSVFRVVPSAALRNLPSKGFVQLLVSKTGSEATPATLDGPGAYLPKSQGPPSCPVQRSGWGPSALWHKPWVRAGRR